MTMLMISSTILKKHGSVNQKEEVRNSLSPVQLLIFLFKGAGRKKPQFEHTLWNIYDRVIADLPRSNNSVEGWHSAFATRVTITHPTIQKLADKIRREQSKFEIDVAQLFQGHPPKPKKACYKKLDEKIARVVGNYNPSQILEYLKNIAANVSL